MGISNNKACLSLALCPYSFSPSLLNKNMSGKATYEPLFKFDTSLSMKERVDDCRLNGRLLSVLGRAFTRMNCLQMSLASFLLTRTFVLLLEECASGFSGGRNAPLCLLHAHVFENPRSDCHGAEHLGAQN